MLYDYLFIYIEIMLKQNNKINDLLLNFLFIKKNNVSQFQQKY